MYAMSNVVSRYKEHRNINKSPEKNSKKQAKQREQHTVACHTYQAHSTECHHFYVYSPLSNCTQSGSIGNSSRIVVINNRMNCYGHTNIFKLASMAQKLKQATMTEGERKTEFLASHTEQPRTQSMTKNINCHQTMSRSGKMDTLQFTHIQAGCVCVCDVSQKFSACLFLKHKHSHRKCYVQIVYERQYCTFRIIATPQRNVFAGDRAKRAQNERAINDCSWWRTTYPYKVP